MQNYSMPSISINTKIIYTHDVYLIDKGPTRIMQSSSVNQINKQMPFLRILYPIFLNMWKVLIHENHIILIITWIIAYFPYVHIYIYHVIVVSCNQTLRGCNFNWLTAQIIYAIIDVSNVVESTVYLFEMFISKSYKERRICC